MVSRLLNPDDRQHCEVIGVAELHGRLYILQNKSKCIHVSLADKLFSMLKDVPLDAVIEPTDLAASTSDSCLYVTDVGDIGCIWRVLVEEQVTESALEYVELKLDGSALDLQKCMTAESATVGMNSAQGRDDGQVEQLNSSDIASAASVTENVTSVGEKQVGSKTRDEANKLPEPLISGIEQRKQTGVNLQELGLIHVNNESIEAGALNMANKTKSESDNLVQRMEDDHAKEMIQSLLERTGFLKKISERGNSRPCLLEVSQHYTVKRFLFNFDAISVFCLFSSTANILLFW